MVRICLLVLWEPYGRRRMDFLAWYIYVAVLSILLPLYQHTSGLLLTVSEVQKTLFGQTSHGEE